MLENMNNISDISLPLFAFYLIVFCNFTKEILGCNLIHVLDTNMYAKHLVAFMLLYFLVIIVDPKNIEDNLLVNFGKSILIYIIFIVTTKLSFPIMILLLALLMIYYILGSIAKRKDAEGKEEEYNRLRMVQNILFIIICIISLIGFIIYFIEKYREYSPNFSIVKFLVGNNICRKYTPKSAKII